ncbi:conserved hypothetical protein [Thiocapsa sp. KS1]|nr:conserved hypothetical protein [Thiocapsa sp. KS1]
MNQALIERLLPEVFRRTLMPGSPLAAIIAAMESLLSPAEQALASLPDQLSPDRARDDFVILLAYFVDLDRYLPKALDVDPEHRHLGAPIASGIGRLRELVRAAPALGRWRGTARGLRLFLETATGILGFSVEEAAPTDSEHQVKPFHIRIRAPADARAYHDLVKSIVEQEKPAYVTYEIIYPPHASRADEPHSTLPGIE